MKKLRIAIPTKLYLHANTAISLLNTLRSIGDYTMDVRFLPGKTNLDQARSILVTNWYDESDDGDLFMFIDSDQTFTANDIISLINLKSDIAVGIYCSLAGYPTCRPKNFEKFLTGESNDLFYGATGFMLIRRPILTKIISYIQKENMGQYRFWISPDCPNIIPFFKQRLIPSETLPNSHPEWLGEDYSFCWMARQAGGSIKCHISKTIGHEVITPINFYPPEYKSKKWENNTIVYYLGNNALKWSPETVDSQGIGGSETAVYYLSKLWTLKGYKVVVYGNCIEGVYDGVEYLDVSKFNTNDIFNIIILWRSRGYMILSDIKADRILVDLHDMPYYEFNNIEKVYKVFMKSNFHKSLYPLPIQEKTVVIENGIPEYYFSQEIDIKDKDKNKYKLMYASSFDRGLYEILKWGFPYIKKHVPEAELHVYYGIDLVSDKLKEAILPLLMQPGIINHGRIGQKQLFEEKKTSTIYYYIGCQSEIDCINVKEAVMTGCIPVVSNVNVFIERDYCLKINGDPTLESTHTDAAKKIVKLLTNESYYEKCYNKIQSNKNKILGWQAISDKWLEYFNFDK